MIANNELQFKYQAKMKSRYAERTCYSYEQDLERFFIFFKRKEIVSLTAQEIEVYLNYLTKLTDEEGNPLYTDRSVNRHRAAITGLYNYTIEEGFRRDNPLRVVKSRQVSEETLAYLSEREVQVLLLKISQSTTKDKFVAARDHFMIRLTLHTGLTTHEITHLQFDQIDFENANLTIYDVNHNERLVPLPMVLKEEYEEYLERRHEIQCEEEAEQLVFVNQQGTKIKAQTSNNTL